MRTLRGPLGLLLLLVAGPGCQVLHSYRPMPVEVRDADTKQPIAGADLRISYPLSNSLVAPSEALAKTEGDGIARLRAAPFGDAGIMLDVTAKDYMNEVKFLTVQQVDKFERAGLFENVQRRPACYVVELYKEPRPNLELLVPAGYRGVVKVRIQVQDDAPSTSSTPGERIFRYSVPASGELVVTGPALFRHIVLKDIKLKSAGGEPLTWQAHESALGYWFLKSEHNYSHFLVGTLKDLDNLRRSMMPRRMLDDDLPGVRQTEGFTRRRRRDPGAGDVNPAMFERNTSD